MEKSIILSKTAILAMFLVAIASCVSFSSATRAQALVELESEPAPIDKVKFCHTKADCKNTRCYPTRSPAVCNNGVCEYDDAKDSPVVMKDETCSTITDCKSTKCLPQPGWHVECVDGKCKCVFDVPPRSKVVTDEKCTVVKDCKSTICMDEIGWHVQCVNGICKCVHVGPPEADSTVFPPAAGPNVDQQGCPPSDCYEISCVEGCPERVHGQCQCVQLGAF
ncbi:hypothetical protein ACLB2K_036616 [Fragaria x ananassa]